MILLSMFTRQHYKGILDIIAQTRGQGDYILVNKLADYFKEDNPLFSREKFFKYYDEKCEEITRKEILGK